MDKRESSITFAKQRLLFDRVVFIDGTAHSGKMMLGPILSAFHRVELQKLDTVFEHVAVLHHFGKITLDGAVTLMREALDESLYNLMIGRNTNFRPSDLSSVFQGFNQQRYLQRLFDVEGESIVQKIQEERPIFQNLTHEILGFISPCFEAFGEKFRLVEVIRHPNDLVLCWLKRGWGEARLAEDPRSFVITVDHQGRQLPYYAIPFKDAFHEMEAGERVINCISSCHSQILRTYSSLDQHRRAQIIFIKFEDFVTKTAAQLDRLANFLDLQAGPLLDKVLLQQRCPRTLDTAARDEAVSQYLKQTPEYARRLLSRMIEEYEDTNVLAM